MWKVKIGIKGFKMKQIIKWLVLSSSAVFIVGCQLTPQQSEGSKFDEPSKDSRVPAYSFAEDVKRNHKIQLQNQIVSQRSAQLYKELIGAWTTECILRQTGSMIREISFYENSTFSQTLTYFLDKGCVSKVKTESHNNIVFETFLAAEGSLQFHGNLDWSKSVGSVTSAKSNVTISSHPNTYPFFLGALSDTQELFLFPMEPGRACQEPVRYVGRDWCFSYRRKNN